MGVAAQITENLFGATEGPFSVHHPLDSAKRRQILQESISVTESFQRGKELELALVKGVSSSIRRSAPIACQRASEPRWR
jgi:hypothetical protein